VGLIVRGPIGLAGGAVIGGIIIYEYERYIWKKIPEIVKKAKFNQQLNLLTNTIQLGTTGYFGTTMHKTSSCISK
jgi:hypothetical protein